MPYLLLRSCSASSRGSRSSKFSEGWRWPTILRNLPLTLLGYASFLPLLCFNSSICIRDNFASRGMACFRNCGVVVALEPTQGGIGGLESNSRFPNIPTLICKLLNSPLKVPGPGQIPRRTFLATPCIMAWKPATPTACL